MGKGKYRHFFKGDVIRTHPEDGFYGIAVVLDDPERVELSPGRLSYPLCHIAVTPLLFRHEVTIKEIHPEDLRPLLFQNYARRADSMRIPWRLETCIHIYTYRNKAGLPVIGRIDPSAIYTEPLIFEPMGDRFFLRGDVDALLGREAYICYERNLQDG